MPGKGAVCLVDLGMGPLELRADRLRVLELRSDRLRLLGLRAGDGWSLLRGKMPKERLSPMESSEALQRVRV